MLMFYYMFGRKASNKPFPRSALELEPQFQDPEMKEKTKLLYDCEKLGYRITVPYEAFFAEVANDDTLNVIEKMKAAWEDGSLPPVVKTLQIGRRTDYALIRDVDAVDIDFYSQHDFVNGMSVGVEVRPKNPEQDPEEVMHTIHTGIDLKFLEASHIGTEQLREDSAVLETIYNSMYPSNTSPKV